MSCTVCAFCTIFCKISRVGGPMVIQKSNDQKIPLNLNAILSVALQGKNRFEIDPFCNFEQRKFELISLDNLRMGINNFCTQTALLPLERTFKFLVIDCFLGGTAIFGSKQI
jgi:hypothetical protein